MQILQKIGHTCYQCPFLKFLGSLWFFILESDFFLTFWIMHMTKVLKNPLLIIRYIHSLSFSDLNLMVSRLRSSFMTSNSSINFVGFFIFLDLHFYHCLRFFKTSKSPPFLTSFSSIMLPNSQHMESIFHPIHNFLPPYVSQPSWNPFNWVSKFSLKKTLDLPWKDCSQSLEKPSNSSQNEKNWKNRQRFETFLELDTLWTVGSLFLGGGANVLVAKEYILGIGQCIILIGPSPQNPQKKKF